MTYFSISADFGSFSRMGMRVGRDRVSKHYPRKGTETICQTPTDDTAILRVSKHYPRKGTETILSVSTLDHITCNRVSKHYPRKGTETS